MPKIVDKYGVTVRMDIEMIVLDCFVVSAVIRWDRFYLKSINIQNQNVIHIFCILHHITKQQEKLNKKKKHTNTKKHGIDPRTLRFSGSSCLPAYPGFIVMKNPQQGMRVTIWGSPGNWNWLIPLFFAFRMDRTC